MTHSPASPPERRLSGFTAVELMVVITIIAILSAFGVAAFLRAYGAARTAESLNNLRTITTNTFDWAIEHNDKIPSPIYNAGAASLPDNAMMLGTGLWLDGVLFMHVYPDTDPSTPATSRASAGGHLVGTIFESTPSLQARTEDTNWYHHSYAMNKNLVFDEINQSAPDPYLTEKTRSNITHPVNAMIFIDCFDKNVIDASDSQLVIEAAERHGGNYVLAAFMDGHVDKLQPEDIPVGSVTNDENASRFWRGIEAD